ncbi:MAG TPA: diacylglycerol kinase family protein, partial [Chloroflexota bacterium]
MPEELASTPRALIIYNPAAGQRDRRADVQAVMHFLMDRGWDVALDTTSGRGTATALAARAVDDGRNVVLVAGGDGTLNEAIQALAHTDVALGVLPSGTGNVWAKELRLPEDNALAAARLLADGVIRSMDLGLAGQRYFMLMAGVGFDAEVTRAVEAKLKRRLGVLAFILTGVPTALQLPGARATIAVDGRRFRRRLILLVVGNTRVWGGGFQITDVARADDGLLDACLFEGRGLFAKARHFLSVILRRHRQDPEVEYFQA